MLLFRFPNRSKRVRSASPEFQQTGENSGMTNYRSRVPSDVADIAQIDKDKKVLDPNARKKRRAGGGRSPLGESIRRPPLVGGATACQTASSKCKNAMPKYASFFLPGLLYISVGSPGGLRIPSGRLKKPSPFFFSLQFSILVLISIFYANLFILEPKVASKIY